MNARVQYLASLFRRFTDTNVYRLGLYGTAFPLKYGKFATKYPWIYGYFLQCTAMEITACVRIY